MKCKETNLDITEDQDALPSDLGIKPEAGLGKFVIFAASKDPSVPLSGGPGPAADLPDVAVGLALAAHLARHDPELGDVSLVVIPQYLEADPKLENDLRAQKGEVLGGIVLGGPSRISDDTRTLLRQILRAPDDTSILGGLQGSLGNAAGLVAAILALLVGTTASAAAVGAARTAIASIGGEDVDETPTSDTPPVKDGEKSSDRPASVNTSATATPVPPKTGNTPFDVSERGEPDISVSLTGGGTVTGIYKGEEMVGGVAFMKLAHADIAEDGQDVSVVETDVTLIPVANIRFTTIKRTPSGGA